MINKTVKTVGGDASSITTLNTVLAGLFPLTDDVTVEFDPGIWDDTYITVGFNMGSSLVWNGHVIHITSADKTNPAQLLRDGQTVFASSAAATGNQKLVMSHLIVGHQNDYKICYCSENKLGLDLYNCLVVSRDASTLLTGFTTGTVRIYNNTFALPNSTMFIELGTESSTSEVRNNIFLLNVLDSGSYPGIGFGSAKYSHNVFYNYYAGQHVFLYSGTNEGSNVLDQDPVLATSPYIAAPSDSVSTILARSAAITAGSTMCIDAATNSLLAGDDLIGTVRPQGSAGDIGAYEYIFPIVSLLHAGVDAEGTPIMSFYCRACSTTHSFYTAAGRVQDETKPTVRTQIIVDAPGCFCHVVITDGILHYLPDCTHAMAGLSMPMVTY